MKHLLLLVMLFLGLAAKAQQTADTLQSNIVLGDTVQPSKLKKEYDPKKASTLSAILPGLGQIYNDSWWKVPILYTGLGVAAYYVDYNNGLRKDYIKLANDLIEEKENGGTINENLLRVYRRRADTWRKNRDLVILTMVGIYALNIVEATVDAHLKGFNVSDDLAMNFKPKIGVISSGTPYVGIGITIPIRSK